MSKSMQKLLRIEGAFVFLACVYAYHLSHESWGIFALLFFVPDVGMAGYLINARIGALTYNLLHHYALPLGLGLIFHFLNLGGTPIFVIWVAHIGFDRALGYGLKSISGFKDTHLGSL